MLKKSFKRVSEQLIRGLVLGSLLLSAGCFSGGYNNHQHVSQRAETVATPSIASTSGTTSSIEDKYYVLCKQAPQAVALGACFEYIYTLTPRCALADVTVRDVVPEGATLEATMPTADVDGNEFSWHFDNLNPNQPVTMRAKVRADEVTLMRNCAYVEAHPIACACVAVMEPCLKITKTGPECACVGDCASFDICVTNTGNFPAHEVVLTDMVPDGLKHSSGKQMVKLDMGTIRPGESRKATISLQVCGSGELCNIARVTSCNCDGSEAKACINADEPGIAIEKVGPAMQFIDKSATYQIHVTNTGTLPLQNAIVTDRIPSGTKLVSAPGADCGSDHVKWCIPRIEPGQTETLEITLCGCRCGETCNEAIVEVCSCNCKLNASDTAKTEWRGHPALLIEARDDCDPVLVGDTTCYTIRVTNQGTDADHNVQIDVMFDEHLDPKRATGGTAGTVDGKMVSFDPIRVLNCGECVTYHVTACGVAPGDSRLTVIMNSDMLESPVTEEEATQVY